MGRIRGVRPGALARGGELLLGVRQHRGPLHRRGQAGGDGQARLPGLGRAGVGRRCPEGPRRVARARTRHAAGRGASAIDDARRRVGWGNPTHPVRQCPGVRRGASGGRGYSSLWAGRLECAAVAPLPVGPLVSSVRCPTRHSGLTLHSQVARVGVPKICPVGNQRGPQRARQPSQADNNDTYCRLPLT